MPKTIAGCLLAAFVAGVASAPQCLEAQAEPVTPASRDPAVDRRYAPAEPLVDRKVSAAMSKFSKWKAAVKKEHFTAYLVFYTCLLGLAVGGTYGFLAFRFGDAMALYHRVRRKTFLISLACGLGVGVFAALSEIPPSIPGKLSMLLLAMFLGVASTSMMTMFLFVFQRRLMEVQARRIGAPVTSRLRAP